LRARRGQRPIDAVAKAWRISPQTYRQIELGRQRPQIRTCYKLAGFLGKLPEAVIRMAGYAPAEAQEG
jgi:DNA-binding XRE family transcriptional regulator